MTPNSDQWDNAPKVYAGKLREMGFAIDDEIPDCAWIPLIDSIETLVWTTEVDGDTVRVVASCRPQQPFRWKAAARYVYKA